MGESKEHSIIKGIIKRKLEEWFDGIAVKEYLTSGRRLDVFKFQYSS